MLGVTAHPAGQIAAGDTHVKVKNLKDGEVSDQGNNAQLTLKADELGGETNSQSWLITVKAKSSLKYNKPPSTTPHNSAARAQQQKRKHPREQNKNTPTTPRRHRNPRNPRRRS